MKTIFNIILRYHYFLLFVLLEGLALFLAIRTNQERNAFAVSTANVVTGYLQRQVYIAKSYLNLSAENEKLHNENAWLRGQLESGYKTDTSVFRIHKNTELQQQYTYKSAKIINNSVYRENNYLTLDVGRNQGIEPDLAVISSQGVVGIVTNVSDNYSTAISLLNTKVGVSARIKKNNYFGSIIWNGQDYRIAILKEIPNHVDVNKGDTIVTSSFSALFPDNIPVGTVLDYSKNADDNFYTIKVLLSTDFKNIEHVYIVKNLFKKEQKDIEKKTEDQIN